MGETHQFRQVDVFGSGPLTGNPVAVVHDADDLDDARMQLFAQWTNLSETTFLLRPTSAEADYRLRIFTASRELPFAGHPTLGSAHAWLEAGGTPRGEAVVQECGAGLVTIARGDRLAFEAPPLLRDGPVSDEDLDHVTRALRITRDDIVDSKWCDNGPGWVGVLLKDARAVLDLRPDPTAFDGWDIGVVGPWTDGGSGRGRRGARLRHHRRGPGHRQPQRQPRAVAGRQPAAGAVRRRAGHRHRPRRPGAREAGGEHGVGGRRHRHDAPWRGHDLVGARR